MSARPDPAARGPAARGPAARGPAARGRPGPGSARPRGRTLLLALLAGLAALSFLGWRLMAARPPKPGAPLRSPRGAGDDVAPGRPSWPLRTGSAGFAAGARPGPSTEPTAETDAGRDGERPDAIAEAREVGGDEGSHEPPPRQPGALRAHDILAGMAAVTPKISACYAEHKEPGLIMVAVVIDPSGSVKSAAAQGTWTDTPTGACVEKAVLAATFPASTEGFATSFPFMLK